MKKFLCRIVLMFVACTIVQLFELYCHGQEQTAQLAPGFETGLSPDLSYANDKLLHITAIPANLGLQIRSIQANSPVRNVWDPQNERLRASLEVGDVICSIDGKSVFDVKDLTSELRQPKADFDLGVVDKNTNRIAIWRVRPVRRIVQRVQFAPAPVEKQGNTNHLHVFVFAATDDRSLQASIQMSLGNLVSFFEGQVIDERCTVKCLTGGECTARKMLETIQSVPAGFDDTILIYYLGHGAYDSRFDKDPFAGHFLDFPGEDLLRKTVWDYFESIPGRFKVLISDSCNVQSTADPEGRVLAAAPRQAKSIQGPTQAEWLFLGHEGSCDLNAASRGEYAWYSPEVGGWFTEQLMDELARQTEWPEIGDNLPRKTDAYFQEQRVRVLAHPASTTESTLDNLRRQKNLTPRISIDATKDLSPPVDPTFKRIIGVNP